MNQNSFYNSIVNFNAAKNAVIINDEIILEGLFLFKNITGFKSASLFLNSSNKIDYYLKDSTSSNHDIIQNLYNELRTNGEISKSIDNEEILESDRHLCDNQPCLILILPLIVQSVKAGMIILVLDKKESDNAKLKDLCKIHSNYLALLLMNNDLYSELENLKMTDDKIIHYSKDIVQSTKELKKILDSIQVGILIIDKKSNEIIDVNKAASKLFDLGKYELIGTPVAEHFVFTDNSKIHFTNNNSEELLLKKCDGTLIPIIKTDAFFDASNEQYIIESFIDISERKKMEEALQQAHYELERRVEERTLDLSEANKHLQNEISERIKAEKDLMKIYWAVHQSPASIIITDLKGDIEYVNPKFTDITGYKYQEVINQNPKMLKSGELSSGEYKNLWDTLLDDREWRGEFRNRKKNGDLYWVSASISPVRNDNKDITNYLAIEEDITERKRFLEELIITKQQAEKSDRIKSSLLANMSHEIRTPLIGIIGYSEILMNEIHEADLLDIVKDIYSSGNRLLKTLNNVLYLSHIENISIELVLERINVVEELESCISEYKKIALEKEISLEMKINRRDIYVKAEKDLFNHAIGSIIDNALKFTAEGAVNIIVDNTVRSGKNWTEIKIQDTGIGISNEDQDKIFEAFRQVSEGYSRNYEGCGLGLTIAQKILDIFRGEITIESEPAKGSTFSVWLPLIS
jgi:PAS domain S-box-containing protein